MNRRILLLLAVFGLVSAASSVSALADATSEIHDRMARRIAQVDDLKLKGAVGENNRGFLEVRDSAAGAASLVAEENRDREAAYSIIAQKTNSTADAVGRARAKQIAAKSPSGIWLQDESGRWSKK
jgi:uncharacterized protein